MTLATSDLRKLSSSELERLGQQSLRDHLEAQAVIAHQKYSPLTAEKFDALLHDPECLRHPVRLAFEFGEMAMHQFAQPDIDWRNTEQDGRVLYVRPLLRDRRDLLPLAVAYMIPVINYGDVISDEHCLAYGATLLGLTENEYYRALTRMSDDLGAEARVYTSGACEPSGCGRS
ncbi:MAG: hypothetical protein IT581_05050 [Verrucomicrobiales bacterium]|nr:hypothetical protein [Verrucomicrobiales bacterium]